MKIGLRGKYLGVREIFLFRGARKLDCAKQKKEEKQFSSSENLFIIISRQ